MVRLRFQWQLVIVFCLVCIGCSGASGLRIPKTAPSSATAGPARPTLPEISDWGWSERVVTEEELVRLEMMDPNMNPTVTHQILARLNGKAPYYIYDDIRKGKTLRVPNDFRAYQNWTPLPHHAEPLASSPKTILVVRDIPFIGWYESGNLVADSVVSLGKPGEETEVGVYRILDKAVDKYSLSYRNDFGEPAWMPWAMRIYGTVWIHAGDIAGPYCSHGCVMLPMDHAENLYRWSDDRTTVVVVESLAMLTAPTQPAQSAKAKPKTAKR